MVGLRGEDNVWKDILKSPYKLTNPNFPKRETGGYWQAGLPKFNEKIVETIYQGNQEGGSSEYWSTNIYEAMPYALYGSTGGNFRMSGKPIINVAKLTEDEVELFYDFNDTTMMTGKQHIMLGGTGSENKVEFEIMPINEFNKHYNIFKSSLINASPLFTTSAKDVASSVNSDDLFTYDIFDVSKDELQKALDTFDKLFNNLNSSEQIPKSDMDMFIGNAVGVSIKKSKGLFLLLLQLRLLEIRYGIGG